MSHQEPSRTRLAIQLFPIMSATFVISLFCVLISPHESAAYLDQVAILQSPPRPTAVPPTPVPTLSPTITSLVNDVKSIRNDLNETKTRIGSQISEINKIHEGTSYNATIGSNLGKENAQYVSRLQQDNISLQKRVSDLEQRILTGNLVITLGFIIVGFMSIISLKRKSASVPKADPGDSE